MAEKDNIDKKGELKIRDSFLIDQHIFPSQSDLSTASSMESLVGF